MDLPIALPSRRSASSWLAAGVAIVLVYCGLQRMGVSAETIRFNEQIRPILSDKCYACHGFDEGNRQAELRLDTAEGAFADRGGAPAVVPGDPSSSELWRRVASDSADQRMPPPDSDKVLSDAEKSLLRLWIEQGAPFQEHWAFQPPVAIDPPAAGVESRNPIDAFIAARLQSAGLVMSPEADRRTLVRRVSFALTGLPPTPAEVDAFVADTSPEAYARMLDGYLQSPRYGEEMARHWLDVARYADTHGMHLDNERQMWAYRDWVVNALNRNQPFDQFTMEQLAGDLLPEPTQDQLIATGFNRCNVTTSEGGSIDEEFVFRYAVDRASTTVQAWMGLTAGCAVCHDHKFDPITQREFYSLYAFFHSAADPAMDGNALLTQPVLQFDAPEIRGQLASLDAQIAAKQRQVDQAAGQPQMVPLAEELAKLREARKSLENSIPGTFIYRDLPQPRESFVMIRGAYNKPGEKVQPGVPAILPPLKTAGGQTRATRLDLARWLVSPEHPLTARVTVNRFWQQFFGVGLVKSSDDFGTQGELPSHPELLDWLAVHFRQSGWDVKQLVRTMLSSATFRQSSRITPDLYAPIRRTACSARSPVPPGCRTDSRQCAVCEWTDKPGDGRQGREAVPARERLGAGRLRGLEHAVLPARQRVGIAPAEPVHVPQAHGAAAVHGQF